MNNPTASPQALEYWIDAHDRIVHLDRNWDITALGEGAAHLVAGNVLHRSLWGFISDRTTRLIYRLLVERVRLRQTPILLTARCDTPTQRRTIEIALRPAVERQIHFTSTVIEAEARAPVALLDSGLPRSESLVILCSWCKRVELPDGRWVEIEDAVNTLDILNNMPLPRISHGMCIDCLVSMKQEIARQI